MIDEKCIHPPLKKKTREPSLYLLCTQISEILGCIQNGRITHKCKIKIFRKMVLLTLIAKF